MKKLVRGLWGMGEDYYPMPWPNLKYDTSVGGYRAAITEDKLKGAPRFNRNTDWDWLDRAKDESVYNYYGRPALVLIEPQLRSRVF